MKKTLVSALTTALVVGAASTTFAAANPFQDVPADHWAYDAVAQLAADGVIEGYGDGTYRGDQEITRYEMAQMVARAMAKGANGADKALIDKLAAEFADELNSLGVRVSALEKKVDNVKWPGEVRYRYIQNRSIDGKDYGQYITLRLEPEMQINDKWSGHARIDYNLDMDRGTNNSPVNNPAGQWEDVGVRVERAWAQGDYDNFQIMLGRLPYVTFADNGMIFDGNISGGQLTFGKDIKATLTLGRAQEDYVGGLTASYQGIEIYNDRDAKFTWGLGYHHVQNKEFFEMPGFYNEAGKSAANIWAFGLGYKFNDDFALNAAYAFNSSGDVKGYKHAASIELDYKGSDPEEPGTYGAFIAYRRLGHQVVIAPTYDAMGSNIKGWEIGVDYTFVKNIQGIVKYGHGKRIFGGGNDKTLFTELNFFF